MPCGKWVLAVSWMPGGHTDVSMSKLGRDLSCQEPLGWAEFKCHYSSFYAPQGLICEQLCQLFGTVSAAMKAPACGVNSSLDL